MMSVQSLTWDSRTAIPGVSLLPMMPFLQSLTTKKDRLAKEIGAFSRALEDVST